MRLDLILVRIIYDAIICFTTLFILRITTQQKCLNGRELELIVIMAPWPWLHNNTDIQFHRTFSKYIPALRFPLKFTTSLIAELSLHNVFKLFAYWVVLYFEFLIQEQVKNRS